MALITGRELAVKVIDQVTKHPETHEQATWISGCGTIACLAGWTVALNRQPGESNHDVKARIAVELRPVDAWGRTLDGEAGMVPTWSEAGATLFGITDEDGRIDQDEADRIFMCMDETEAVARLADRFDIELPEGYNA